MSKKENICLEKFAKDEKGNVKFATFCRFLKKVDHHLLNSVSTMGLSLIFGVIFLLFSYVAIGMVMGIGVKIAYLTLSGSLCFAGFGYFLHSLNEAFKHYKFRLDLKKGIPTDSDLFHFLLTEEKILKEKELNAKSEELQKIELHLKELHRHLEKAPPPVEEDQKIIKMS